MPMAVSRIWENGAPSHEPISSYLGQSISQQLDRTIKPVTVLQQNTS